MRSGRLESMRKYVRICYSSCNRGPEETVGCLMRSSCRYTRIWCNFCDRGSRRREGILRGGCATLCGFLEFLQAWSRERSTVFPESVRSGIRVGYELCDRGVERMIESLKKPNECQNIKIASASVLMRQCFVSFRVSFLIVKHVMFRSQFCSRGIVTYQVPSVSRKHSLIRSSRASGDDETKKDRTSSIAFLRDNLFKNKGNQKPAELHHNISPCRFRKIAF